MATLKVVLEEAARNSGKWISHTDARAVLALLAAAKEHRRHAAIVGHDWGPSDRLDKAIAAFEE